MPLLPITTRQPDGTPLLGEEEQLMFSEPNVALFFDASQSEGVGTLFITSKNVIWLSASDASKGYSMDYYFIGIHAISTDSSSFPYPCIYCQLESEETPEARFVPQQTDHLQTVYKAFCDGAILNPDEEEEGEGDFFYNEEEVHQGLLGERAQTSMEGVITDNNGMFEDCEDEDEELEED